MRICSTTTGGNNCNVNDKVNAFDDSLLWIYENTLTLLHSNFFKKFIAGNDGILLGRNCRYKLLFSLKISIISFAKWKSTRIFPLHKRGDRSFVPNYRCLYILSQHEFYINKSTVTILAINTLSHISPMGFWILVKRSMLLTYTVKPAITNSGCNEHTRTHYKQNANTFIYKTM